MRKSRKKSAVFLFLAALLLFAAQSVHAFTSVSAVDALAGLQADPTAVMFDTRTVDEHNHQKQPWQGAGLDTTAPAGTAVWTVNGVEKMPITVPYWYAGTTRVAPGPPEDEAEVRAIIGGLLETGEINYNTPIFLVCRTAYRSYYMAEWMDTTTFAPGTGAAGQADSQSFTNLINIDGDTPPVAPANAQGGMKEWNIASLPLYPGNFVPAQVFSKLPADGYTETAGNTLTFTMSVLEPSAGRLSYPAIIRVSLEIDGVENNSDTTDTTGALWTDYNIVSTPLANGTHAWEAKVANNTAEDRVSWSSHYLGSGMGERAVTVDAVVTPVFTNASAAAALAALEADPTAVMFDTRTVDEHNHQKQPWQGSGLDTTAPAGTAMWTVGGVSKLPITVPYWYAGTARVVPGPPEDEVESINIIEGLLAAGEIDFNTPIYLICRTAYRSYYMAQWMNTLTFYNARTGVSDYFTNLINIDSDLDPTNAQGGMKEWNLASLPIYGSDIVPPQVFSISPEDGFTETGSSDVTFTVSILEASTGRFVPPAVSRVALTINGSEADFNTGGTTGGLWTNYSFLQTLVNGTYVWNPSAENSAGISWNSHYLGSALGGRSLVVDLPVLCIDNDADGYGSPGDPSCPNGSAEDCDDTDSSVNPGASDFICNGVDNNCDGTPDDEYLPTDTICGLGVCESTGLIECINGSEIDSCVDGTPTGDDTDCNGIDDDCDGIADNNYVPADTSCGVGECSAAGLLECVDGAEIDSCVEGTPQTEGPFGDATCSDSLDNDCDGDTDTADADCNEVCITTGDDTDCDGIDDDCDGMADNNYVPTDTSCGVGECSAAGLLECVDGAEVDSCVEGTPQTEGPYGDATCSDSLDNDCDGDTDAVDPDCGVTCVPTASDDTTCDGIDDDCNGVIDDGFVGYDTTCGVGECASTGRKECIDGKKVNTCTAGTPGTEGPYGDATCSDSLDNDCDGDTDAVDPDCGATCVPTASDDTTCDGIDDDCNGVIDDGFVGYDTTCGVGECASTGRKECIDGKKVNTCVAGTPATDDATCDGLDNDCDGVVDNDYVPTDTNCGIGACEAIGLLECVNGGEINSCVAGTPQTEGPTGDATCADSTDNDCDGLTDNVDPDCGTVTVTSYTIKATAGWGGKISPSGDVIVEAGDNQTFKIKPRKHGYFKIKDVLVDGVSVGPVESYTFKNVSSDHTIHAEFTKKHMKHMKRRKHYRKKYKETEDSENNEEG